MQIVGVQGLHSSVRPVAANRAEPQDLVLPARNLEPGLMPPPMPTSADTSAIQAVLDEEKRMVAAGQLQPGCESIFLPRPGAAKGTVLLFHGYTAGPWQYKELAQRFHDA